MMYMPIWIIYWFQIIFPINYFIKYGIIYFILFLYSKASNRSGIFKITDNIKIFLLSVFAEFFGILVFCLCETTIDASIYYAHYTMFCLFALSVTMILSLLLSYFFGLNKIKNLKKHRVLLSILLTIFSAPYLFLLPSGVVC